MAWINVGVVVIGWALWGADVYVASQREILVGMKLCIGGECVMMLWLTWAMIPILREAFAFCCFPRCALSALPQGRRDSAWGDAFV